MKFVLKTEMVQAVQACIADVNQRLDEYLDLISDLVNLDSGSDNPQGIYLVQQKLADRLPGEVTTFWKKTREGISHLRATIPGNGERIVLLVCP